MHPYEMSTTLRERRKGERRKGESIKLNYGSLYSVVQSLQRGGLIEPVETTRDGRRPGRTVDAVTPAGRAELVDRPGDLLGEPKKEFTHFEAALSLLGALPPDAAVRLLDLRLRALRLEAASRQGIRAAHPDLPEMFLIEDDYEGVAVEFRLGTPPPCPSRTPPPTWWCARRRSRTSPGPSSR